MKALTVRQPWAWAITTGEKTIENRTTNWRHRGPLLIHAGAAYSQRGIDSDLIHDLWQRQFGWDYENTLTLTLGAIIGQVDLVGVHRAEPGCCESPWAERVYTEASGKIRRSIQHLELENARSYGFDPIECLGRLGLWDVDDDVLEEVARREAVINRG